MPFFSRRAGCRLLRRVPAARLALLAAGISACGAEPAGGPVGSPEGHPVILVGVDGWEWDLTLELIADGRLPNVARLIDEGTCGELRTFKPAMSPVIWTTIVTGTGPRQHGIAGFVKDAGDGPDEGAALYTSRDRRVKAIWNILSDAGIRSNVVGWWTTFPVEPIDGVMVAQVSTLDPSRLPIDQPRGAKGGIVPGLAGQIHPPEREAELFAILDGVEKDLPGLVERLTGGSAEELDPLARKLFEGCTWALRSDAVYHRVALRLLEEEPRTPFLAVYFGGPDVFGHRFWRYTYPDEFQWKPSPEELERAGDFVRAYYELVDGMIGEIVAAAPVDANVVLVSDHGMRPGRTRQRFREDQPLSFILSGQHKQGPPSFFVARGPAIAADGRGAAGLLRGEVRSRGAIGDVTPTLLVMLGLPVGRDMEGAPMTDVLSPGLLEAQPVRWIDTHTPEGWREARSSEPVETPDTEERLEQLRALGYLD